MTETYGAFGAFAQQDDAELAPAGDDTPTHPAAARDDTPLRRCLRELVAYAVAGGEMPDKVRQPLLDLIRDGGVL